MNKTVVWIVAIGIIVLGFYIWWSGMQEPRTLNENQNATTTTDTTSPVSVGNVSRKGFTSNVISSISDASSFAAFLSASGVDATLRGTGPYTVFVPINAAFDHAPEGVLSVTGAERKRLVQYHVISGKKIDPNLLVSGTETALSGDPLNMQISQLDHVARVNGALILSSYSASNGVIYLINGVLIPPQKPNYQ